MYCINCEKELTAEARFCHFCGRAQGEEPNQELSPYTSAREVTWEICDIAYVVVPRGCLAPRMGQFQAKMTSPTGVAFIGNSPTFLVNGIIPAPDGRSKAALDALVADLLRSGWEPTGLSDNVWFQQRFRRHATYDAQSPQERTRRQLEGEAHTLYTYLRTNGVRLKETACGELLVHKGPRLTRESQAAVRRLSPQIREYVRRELDA